MNWWQIHQRVPFRPHHRVQEAQCPEVGRCVCWCCCSARPTWQSPEFFFICSLWCFSIWLWRLLLKQRKIGQNAERDRCVRRLVCAWPLGSARRGRRLVRAWPPERAPMARCRRAAGRGGRAPEDKSRRAASRSDHVRRTPFARRSCLRGSRQTHAWVTLHPPSPAAPTEDGLYNPWQNIQACCIWRKSLKQHLSVVIPLWTLWINEWNTGDAHHTHYVLSHTIETRYILRSVNWSEDIVKI